MTALRKRMLEELQRRNYSPTTIRAYLHAVETFARHFGKSPDKLDQEHLRQYQLHLLHDRKFTVGTIVSTIAALRFFFVRVLRRPYREIDLVVSGISYRYESPCPVLLLGDCGLRGQRRYTAISGRLRFLRLLMEY